MDMVDTKYGGAYAIGFDAFWILYWRHRSHSVWSRTKSNQEVSPVACTTTGILWTSSETVASTGQFLSFCMFPHQDLFNWHVVCSRNNVPTPVPTSVQLAVDQSNVETLADWTWEVRPGPYKTVPGTWSQILSQIYKTFKCSSDVHLGSGISFHWTDLQFAASIGVWYYWKVSCLQTVEIRTVRHKVHFSAVETVSSDGWTFSHKMSISITLSLLIK